VTVRRCLPTLSPGRGDASRRGNLVRGHSGTLAQPSVLPSQPAGESESDVNPAQTKSQISPMATNSTSTIAMAGLSKIHPDRPSSLSSGGSFMLVWTLSLRGHSGTLAQATLLVPGMVPP
jgi:hypothetical protein